MIYASWGACKNYHSDLFQRAMALLMAITGNQGRKGGGLRRNGDFINPTFVEGALAEHPGVTDVFVYGIAAANGNGAANGWQ